VYGSRVRDVDVADLSIAGFLDVFSTHFHPGIVSDFGFFAPDHGFHQNLARVRHGRVRDDG
jgi:hypothetical protein